MPNRHTRESQRSRFIRRIGVWAHGLLLLLACGWSANAISFAAEPLPGQIIIDPEHPQWLKRQGGRHLFICGPGDPEDFLYRGQRRGDGTRDGDQVALIRKLIRYGGNCIYMQIIRSHGGDGPADHNPFVDSDPRLGLDEDILDQWEEWFRLMDDNGIVIYLFFYDDSSRIWHKRGQERVAPAERRFIETIVNRFEHHRNLIWLVAEESEEAHSTERVQAIAEIIRQADDYGHIIGNHHHSGTHFKSWRPGGALRHFAMQYTAAGDKAHAAAVKAFRRAAGRYQVIYAESTAAKPDARHAWRCAMGGLMPMMYGMDIATTPPETLRRCRYLQRFFEATDFYRMAPHDELAEAGTQWVLAAPGSSYIAYAENLTGQMGIKGVPGGVYDLTWLDCASGRTVLERAVRVSGSAHFAKPDKIGTWCAVWVRKGQSP